MPEGGHRSSDRRFEFQKRSQYFIRVHDKPLSTVAMCIRNEDCSPLGINGRTATPTPTSLAQIVSDDFPVFHTADSVFLLSTQQRQTDNEQGAMTRTTIEPCINPRPVLWISDCQ